jgi:hypothetical protein
MMLVCVSRFSHNDKMLRCRNGGCILAVGYKPSSDLPWAIPT